MMVSPLVRSFRSAAAVAASVLVLSAGAWAASQPASLRDCSACTIEHARFAGMDLAGLRLDGATLIDVDLTGANLTGASFEGVTLVGVRLDRAKLSRARFDGADVSATSFRDAALDGVQFQGANLKHDVFAGARMHGAGVFGSRLIDSDLRDADLSAADLATSDLAGSDLRGARLDDTVLCEDANENTIAADGSVQHRRVMQCVGLMGANVEGVKLGSGLACDRGKCAAVDTRLLQSHSASAK
jgi:uncharacterized protein YjbI with pentapeptide repeats